MLFNKQLSIDISRLIFCVFLGYVLPDVAFAQSAGRWTNIAALVVSFSFHTATEVYVLQNVNNPSIRNEGGGFFISSSVLISVVTIWLVLHLGAAILNGKFLRDNLVYKIPRLFSQIEEDGTKMIKDKIFDAWLVARACLEQNWLETSMYAPVVAIIVTICVAAVGAKVGCQKFVLHNNVGLSFYLRCTFILMGWIVILWRSFLVYICYVANDRSIQTGHDRSIDIFCRLIYLKIQIALDPMSLWDVLDSKGVHFPVVQSLFKVLRILASIFTHAVLLAFCLFIGSYLLLLYTLYPLILMTACLLMILRIVMQKLKFIYVEKVCRVCGEEFKVAASSYDETEKSRTKAYEIGQTSQELLDLIEGSVAQNRAMVVSELQHRLHWKMTAVAAISVIVELADGCMEDEEAKLAMEAFGQAEDLLEVLDCPDNIAVDPINLFDTCRLHPYRLNLEAQRKFLELENLFRNSKQHRRVLTPDEVDKVVHWFGRDKSKENPKKSEAEDKSDGCNLDQAEDKSDERQGAVRPDTSFCQDWTKLRFCNVNLDFLMKDKKESMEYVCKVISQRGYTRGNKQDLMNVAVSCLGDIIGACVLLLPDVLLQHRIHWLRDFQDDKLRKAVEIAAKLSGVTEKWNPGERKTDKCADPDDPEFFDCLETESEITEE